VAVGQTRRPRFEDYPVPVYKGRHARPRIAADEREERGLRVAIDDGDQPVNFAGHCRLSEDSCGTDSVAVAIVDVITGKADWGFCLFWSYKISIDPKERAWPKGIEYRPNSALLIGHGCFDEDEPKCGDHYWRMTNGKLVEIRWVPFR
jgi:hypothetical protein